MRPRSAGTRKKLPPPITTATWIPSPDHVGNLPGDGLHHHRVDPDGAAANISPPS